VLVVESDSLARAIMLAHLDARADVVTAATLPEAFACLHALAFDVVLVEADIEGVRAGLPLLTVVTERWPHIRAYAVGDLEPGPGFDVLVKPVLRAELDAILEAAAPRAFGVGDLSNGPAATA